MQERCQFLKDKQLSNGISQSMRGEEEEDNYKTMCCDVMKVTVTSHLFHWIVSKLVTSEQKEASFQFCVQNN
jgi:hypothetical protein